MQQGGPSKRFYALDPKVYAPGPPKCVNLYGEMDQNKFNKETFPQWFLF